MDEAEYLCDEIAIMDQGKIIARDTPQALLNQHFKGAIIRLPQANLEDKKQSDLGSINVEGYIDIDAIDVEKSISELLHLGVSLSGLQVKSANLDDLFVKLTGHALAE
jgi:ABC-2 type transport system ATP-binding protein